MALLVQRSERLEVLDLGDNAIGDAGARALIDSFQHVPNLRTLNLELNEMSEECKTELRAICRDRNIDLSI